MADNLVQGINSPNVLIITDSDQNQVVVTQPVTNVIEVNVPGPQGPVGPAVDTGSLVSTGSFNTFTSSYYQASASFDTRIINLSESLNTLSGSFTGSIYGTASYSDQALSASIAALAVSASQAQNAINAQTASFAPLYTLVNEFGAFTGSYLVASASFDTRILNNSASISSLSSSYLTNSGSVSTRLTSLEQFSSSLDNTFATDAQLNAATASLSGSIAQLSSSYLASSASFDTRILNNSASIASLSGSYLADSASFSQRINDTTASITALSSSYVNFSSSYNTGSFTGSFTGSLLGTSSLSITSSNTVLQSGILTNQTVGALTSGTNLPTGTGLESILRTMLVTYIPPTLSSLSIRSGGSTISLATRDVGNSFTFNTASFSATADNPTGIFPLSSSFTASGADIGTTTYYFGNNVLNTSNILSVGGIYTINRATSGTVTFTVNGRRSDTGASISGASTSVSFQWRNYLAASSTIPVDNSTAQTVVNATVTSTLGSSKTWTATCTSGNDTTGNYTYIIYPASYGDLSNVIQNGALSVLSAFTKLGDFTITNAYGASITVRIYKSNSDKAFASGTTLAIS